MNYWQGKIQDLDVPGPNGRIFTTEIGKSILDQYKMRQSIGSSWLGTMINDWNNGAYMPQNVTHKVIDLWMHENALWASILIYEHSRASMLSKILETPGKASFVLCGDGEIVSKGDYHFIQNYHLQSIVGVLL